MIDFIKKQNMDDDIIIVKEHPIAVIYYSQICEHCKSTLEIKETINEYICPVCSKFNKVVKSEETRIKKVGKRCCNCHSGISVDPKNPYCSKCSHEMYRELGR